MPWKKSDFIINQNFNRKGLAAAVAAGMVCQEAQRLYPDLFRAVSLKNGVFHLQVAKLKLRAFKQIEGKMLEEISVFAKSRNLPVPTQIRLTTESENPIL